MLLCLILLVKCLCCNKKIHTRHILAHTWMCNRISNNVCEKFNIIKLVFEAPRHSANIGFYSSGSWSFQTSTSDENLHHVSPPELKIIPRWGCVWYSPSPLSLHARLHRELRSRIGEKGLTSQENFVCCLTMSMARCGWGSCAISRTSSTIIVVFLMASYMLLLLTVRKARQVEVEHDLEWKTCSVCSRHGRERDQEWRHRNRVGGIKLTEKLQ